MLLPTTMVGSFPRPGWFTHQLAGKDLLEAFKLAAHSEAFHDATRVVIRDQEDVGLDILADGQMWFDDYHMGIGSFLWYWLERTKGVGVIPRPEAVALGLSGPATFVRIPWSPRLADRSWLMELTLDAAGLIKPVKVGWAERLVRGTHYRVAVAFHEVRDRPLFPMYFAPVVVTDAGRRVIRPMRYTCRLEGKPAFYDRKFPGTYNAFGAFLTVSS